MKSALKILLGTIILAVVLTLAQAETFVGVWEVEKQFFVGVFVDPKAWLGTIVLWKYVCIALAVLGVIVVSTVNVIKKSVKHCRVKKGKELPEPKKFRRLNRKTDGTVHSNLANTSTPGKFIRVNPKK